MTTTTDSITLIGFTSDSFGARVLEHLERRGVKHRNLEHLGLDHARAESALLFPRSQWHREAWKRRLDGHEHIFGDALGKTLQPEDWMNLLVCLDRVFIDKRPVAESIGYVAALLRFASEMLTTIPAGEPLLFLATPHFTRDLAISVAARAVGHRVYVVRPSHARERVWISELHGTQFGNTVDLEYLETYDMQIPIGVSQALINSKEQAQRIERDHRRGAIQIAQRNVRRLARITNLQSFVANQNTQPLRWPKEHYWGYLSHRAMVHLKLLATFERRRTQARLREHEYTGPIPRSFIYFPLHYQPERTTVPEAGIWRNQISLARALSAYCERSNEDLHLLVKEHPRQLVGDPRQTLMRSSDFYDTLAALPKTKLLPQHTEASALLASARIVVTPNGSSAWEALRHGTPSLTTAETWHSSCAASPHANTETDIFHRLDELLVFSAGQVTSCVQDFLHQRSVLVPGVFSDEHLSSDTDRDTLATQMADVLVDLMAYDKRRRS